MMTVERVNELIERKWLPGVEQAIADLRTDPKRARSAHHIPIDWRGQNWSGIDADGGNFVKARLWKADLSHGRMEGADFTNADLAGGSLRKSKLRNASFRNAVLAAVDLRGADLRDADFTGADLAHAKLQGADLTGAVLDGADVSGAVFGDEESCAVGLTQQQLAQVRSDEDAPPVMGVAVSAQNGV